MELKRFVNILRFSQQIKLVEAFMLGGLFLFADIVLTVWLTHRFHPFLILGLLFLTAFCGFLFSKIAYSFVYKETRTAFRESGEIPYRQFDKTLGTCVCAFLMVMPGFITKIFAVFSAPSSAAFWISTLKSCIIICGCMRWRCKLNSALKILSSVVAIP